MEVNDEGVIQFLMRLVLTHRVDFGPFDYLNRICDIFAILLRFDALHDCGACPHSKRLEQHILINASKAKRLCRHAAVRMADLRQGSVLFDKE
jgi:hypothetical protein